jgi:hypothetical protein
VGCGGALHHALGQRVAVDRQGERLPHAQVQKGFCGSGVPALSVTKGRPVAREVRRQVDGAQAGDLGDGRRGSRFRRARSLVGTWSIRSTSPESSAAVRPASLGMMR